MEFTNGEIGDTRYIEGRPGERFMETARDAPRLVEACFSHRARAALLYAENLTPQFFDLSSGQAGEILQKIIGYRLRLAVVSPIDRVEFSTNFGQFAAHEARAGHLGIFATRDDALHWLAAAAAASAGAGARP